MNFLRFIFLFSVLLISCKKEKVADNFNIHKIEGYSKHYLELKLPKRFIDIKKNEKSNIKKLSSIIEKQNLFPNFHFFADSSDSKTYISINSGERFNISDKEAKRTYFSVPTISLDKIFPKENEEMKIIFDEQNIKHKGKTYYKRKYIKEIDSSNREILTSYYIITTVESTLVLISSKKEINLDDFILNMTIHNK